MNCKKKKKKTMGKNRTTTLNMLIDIGKNILINGICKSQRETGSIYVICCELVGAKEFFWLDLFVIIF